MNNKAGQLKSLLKKLYLSKKKISVFDDNFDYQFLISHHLLGYIKTERENEFFLRRLLLERERKKVISLLQSCKIPYFELKGVVLENFLKENSSYNFHRFFGDLDIYIPKKKLPQVLEILNKSGFSYFDNYFTLQNKAKKFGSFNLKNKYLKLDLHFNLNKAGKYKIGNFKEREIFSSLVFFEDTFIPSPYYYWRLLFFHFWAKHIFFGLGRLLELLYLWDSVEGKVPDLLEQSYLKANFWESFFLNFFWKLKENLENDNLNFWEKIFYLYNSRLNHTYFEKRMLQFLFFALR